MNAAAGKGPTQKKKQGTKGLGFRRLRVEECAYSLSMTRRSLSQTPVAMVSGNRRLRQRRGRQGRRAQELSQQRQKSGKGSCNIAEPLPQPTVRAKSARTSNAETRRPSLGILSKPTRKRPTCHLKSQAPAGNGKRKVIAKTNGG